MIPSLVTVPVPARLGTFAAPPAPPATQSEELSLLDSVAIGAGATAGAATIGAAVSSAGMLATFPAASAVLNHVGIVEGLFGTLQFAVLSQLGGWAAVAGTAALGAFVAARAMKAPDGGKTIGLVDRPAAAMRDGAAAVAAAQTYGEAAGAGARAGWKAGQTFGAVAGALQGVASGYPIGMWTGALLSASAGAAYAGAIGGALVFGAALALGGRYVGGAVGAGVGAAAGAIAHIDR